MSRFFRISLVSLLMASSFTVLAQEAPVTKATSIGDESLKVIVRPLVKGEEITDMSRAYMEIAPGQLVSFSDWVHVRLGEDVFDLTPEQLGLIRTAGVGGELIGVERRRASDVLSDDFGYLLGEDFQRMTYRQIAGYFGYDFLPGETPGMIANRGFYRAFDGSMAYESLAMAVGDISFDLRPNAMQRVMDRGRDPDGLYYGQDRLLARE